MGLVLRIVRYTEVWIQMQSKSVHRRLTHLHPSAIDEHSPYVDHLVYFDPSIRNTQKPETVPGTYSTCMKSRKMKAPEGNRREPLEYRFYTLDKSCAPEATDQHMFYGICAWILVYYTSQFSLWNS